VSSSEEKRKHARVSHSGTVEFITDGRRFSGRSINVSRSGMQVEVRLPESFESVRRVTFTLPTSDRTISVPFRFVRASSARNADVVGLEFDFEDETQKLLIEEYIRDVKQRSDEEAAAEMRRVPRTECNITDITSSRADVTIHSIDNVSTEGLLLTFEGPLAPGEDLDLRATLPDGGRALKLQGRVVYVIGGGIDGRSVAGLRLHPGSEIYEARLRNFISERRSTDALREAYDSFADRRGDSTDYRMQDRTAIWNLLAEARQRRITVNTLSERTLQLTECRIEEADFEAARVLLVPTAASSEAGPNTPASRAPGESGPSAGPPDQASGPPDLSGGAPDPRAGMPDPPSTESGVYVAFALEGGSYLFKTRGIQAADDAFSLRLPEIVFRSEKRSSQRQDQGEEASVTLRAHRRDAGAREATGGREVHGRLLDVSRRGFLCEVDLAAEDVDVYSVGRTVSYDIDTRLGLSDHGQIRHATTVGQGSGGPGSSRVQLGIEAGVARTSYAFRRIEPEEWDVDPVPAPSVSVSLESVPVRYRDADDREIAALLNATRFPVTAPVVIVPPAFGKKKETLAPFVATLLTNFSRAGRDVVTLRYDGINRPGESYNEVEDAPRGYEMLRYRLSQGLADLRTTIDYVEDNPYFTASSVVLVTASMSSIDARKLLASSDRDRVALWVSLMGVPAAQTTIGNILAGTDIIGNYRLGIPNGVRGMLGHLIDMDTLARDLIEERYAYLTDARVDMSAVSTPVLWIVGRHDHWVDREEVADLMAVDGGGSRELVEIPTGHNLRNSDDAIRTFKLITEYIHRGLYGEGLHAVEPPKEAVLEMLGAERERMMTVRPPALEEYWRDYLLGAGDESEGYDFYGNLADFREFLELEANLIAPSDGDRVADFGCGTGLLTEALLERIARDAGGAAPRVKITAVDLVADALEKTREKCGRLLSERDELSGCSVEYVRRDLEPNRLLPIHRLVDSGGEAVAALRNRVEGLPASVVDLLLEHDGQTLSAVLAGEPVDARRHRELAESLPEHVLPAVLDLNRAARFLRGRIEPGDVSPGRRHVFGRRAFDHDAAKSDTSRSLRSGDLLFDVLHFGDWAVGEHSGFTDASFDKIIASLFLSYLFNPDYAMQEFYRMLAPGGRLLVSTMRPDSDVSTIFTDYVEEVRAQAESGGDLDSAQAMLNEAASLFELEEDGLFRFYTADELVAMFQEAGFTGITVHRSLGTPPQAIIVTGEKPAP
jgi:ubiquinone/menaquinone biosynthesis C-methylase UbiE